MFSYIAYIKQAAKVPVPTSRHLDLIIAIDKESKLDTLPELFNFYCQYIDYMTTRH